MGRRWKSPFPEEQGRLQIKSILELVSNEPAAAFPSESKKRKCLGKTNISIQILLSSYFLIFPQILIADPDAQPRFSYEDAGAEGSHPFPGETVLSEAVGAITLLEPREPSPRLALSYIPSRDPPLVVLLTSTMISPFFLPLQRKRI